MIRIARLLPLCLVFLAAAGDAPQFAPSRDVTVTYRTAHGPIPQTPAKVVVRQTARGTKIRTDDYVFLDVDMPYEGAIVDHDAHQVISLVYSRRVAVESPMPQAAMPGLTLTPELTYQRGTDDKILGFACTNWDVTQPVGGAVKEARQWKVCVTPDGVTLRYVVNGIEWVATSVVFATLPPTVFVPPADMQRLTVTLPAQ